MASIKSRRASSKGSEILMELQKIKCQNCGKVLCEANGEIKKICPKCKKTTHVIVTSFGVYSIVGIDLGSVPDQTHFIKIK